MTEDEWYAKGEQRLEEWAAHVLTLVTNYTSYLSDAEESAFLYAWELAGKEAGVIND